MICGSASKAYAMTGWRCGWQLGPQAVIAASNAIQSHSTSNVTSITQKAAVAALVGSQATVTAMLDEYRKRRDQLHAWLTADPRLRCRKPAGAFYMFVDDRVRKFKDHPAIIAWTIFDDANTLSTVEHLTKMNKLVKEIVPHRLTYNPLGTQSRDVLMPAAGFFGCSDFIGWEMYPVANPKAADPTLKATETQMVLVSKAATLANCPYWILPQTFRWPGNRVPTAAEYRNLCYVGLRSEEHTSELQSR